MVRLVDTNSYQKDKSYLENFDMRCKLFLFLVLNISTIYMGFTGLFITLLTSTILFYLQRISLMSTFKDIKLFLLILILIFLARAITISADTLSYTPFISITYEGIWSGLYFSFRLLIIVLFSIILIRTSTTSEIKVAIQWFLKPVPFIPEKKVSMMLSLMIRYLPLIIEQAKEISDAQKSRGIENRKNPFFRLRIFTIPILSRVFLNAESLVNTMESRCYSENRTEPILILKKKTLLCYLLVPFYFFPLFFYNCLIRFGSLNISDKQE